MPCIVGPCQEFSSRSEPERISKGKFQVKGGHMSERNKELVRRVIDQAVNGGNLMAADELIASDYVYHEATAGEKRGREGFRHLVITYRTAFPNVRLTVNQQIAEGDWVVTRWTATGTHRGKLFGTPPTNKLVTVEGIVISRIADGKIAEEFECYDALGMMRQLGTVKAWGIAA
jgi:steroid delta-isomerase-like uncharacterized protein